MCIRDREKAGQVMGELCKYVDVCISNEEDANDVFGIKSEGTEVTACLLYTSRCV